MWAEQDVAWHNHHSHIFGSVGDDKQLIIWDTRQRCKSAFSLCFASSPSQACKHGALLEQRIDFLSLAPSSEQAPILLLL